MKIKVKRNEFTEGLSKVQGIVGKSPLPILANVLIDACAGNLHLLTTDLELTIKTSLKADVIEEGRTTVNARKLFSIVRVLPEDDVSISLKDNKMSIKSGKSRFNLNTMDAEEFPEDRLHESSPVAEMESR